MGRKVKKLKNYNSSQIKAFINNDAKYKIGIRLYAVYLLSEGKSSRSLEELYNVSFKQICNWADRLDAEGVEGLYNKPRSGRPHRLTDKQQEHLQGILSRSPEEFGYHATKWSAPLVQDYIRKQYHVEYRPSNIYNLLHKLRFNHQRIKGVFPERVEAKRSGIKTDIKKH